MTPRPLLDMTSGEIADLLSLGVPGVLSTIDSTGTPHAAGMYFVHRHDSIEMWTYAKSQKAANLRRDPRCSFLVEDGEPYRDLRGVLVRGRARLVTDHDAIASIGRRLYERYFLPRTGIPLAGEAELEVERQAHKRVGIVLAMERVASWDHARAAAR